MTEARNINDDRLPTAVLVTRHSSVVTVFFTCFLTGHDLKGRRIPLFYPRRFPHGFKHAETKENHEKQGKAQQGQPQSRCKAHAEESGDPEATGREVEQAGLKEDGKALFQLNRYLISLITSLSKASAIFSQENRSSTNFLQA